MQLRFPVDTEQSGINEISPEAAGFIDGVFAEACPEHNFALYEETEGLFTSL